MSNYAEISRRQFVQSAATSALALSAGISLPEPTSAAPVLPAGRWFAVGNDELCYPFWASSRKQAAIYYAQEHGARLGDDCPECGDYECTEHLGPEAWDEPQHWVDVHEPKAWADLRSENEPTNADWSRAGFNTMCQGDPCSGYWDEPQECHIFEGKTLCDECYEAAQVSRLDCMVGNALPTNGRETG